jgi:hypothetical protein
MRSRSPRFGQVLMREMKMRIVPEGAGLEIECYMTEARGFLVWRTAPFSQRRPEWPARITAARAEKNCALCQEPDCTEMRLLICWRINGQGRSLWHIPRSVSETRPGGRADRTPALQAQGATPASSGQRNDLEPEKAYGRSIPGQFSGSLLAISSLNVGAKHNFLVSKTRQTQACQSKKPRLGLIQLSSSSTDALRFPAETSNVPISGGTPRTRSQLPK